jgi:hypothetical protein
VAGLGGNSGRLGVAIFLESVTMPSVVIVAAGVALRDNMTFTKMCG